MCAPHLNTWKVVKIDRSMKLVGKKKTFSPVWAYFGFKPTTDESSRLCKANVSAKSGNTSKYKALVYLKLEQGVASLPLSHLFNSRLRQGSLIQKTAKDGNSYQIR